MTKKDILELIDNKITPKNSKESEFFADKKAGFKNKAPQKNKDTSKTGNSQFRELAAVCLQAECCEEIEILIQYKEAKNTKGESWSRSYKGKTLAKVILDCIETIKKETNGDDKECLNCLSLFFGYLYWYSRVWSADNANSAEEVRR